ncbi:uncharacterized protein EV420DRAFT_1486436 [Desarmillaria tabescens]|uniref:Transmembrane protein n=1 Tax=Armillaria tabescens TaxID=1929756 RepID=A0AA39JAL3_ARMTA|nr:uncharacterized protein EV420DRAFT_1486436 [Desarmillaria tabescens]KAK0439255.1 hypothetical protein EV420DRAFT_1486436 [Desarmillaria tabescens]
MSSTTSNTFNVFTGFLTAIIVLAFCFLYGYLQYNATTSQDENVHADLPIQQEEEDVERGVGSGREEREDAERREQQVLMDGPLWLSADSTDQEYGLKEIRVDLSTRGIIVGPGRHPYSNRLYISTGDGETPFVAYDGIYQCDWEIMDTWHQANRLPPLKDREIPEFNLQYPDSPTIPRRANPSIARGASTATTQGGDTDSASDSSDQYDSWVTDDEEHNPCHTESAMEAYAASFKPLLKTNEGNMRPLSHSSHMSSGYQRDMGQNPNWPSSSSINPYIPTGMSYTEGSKTSPEPSGIKTERWCGQGEQSFGTPLNNPLIPDLRTSLSISGLAILRPPGGTTSYHGSMQNSPTSDWEELLEWQGQSLANEGSWVTLAVAKLMYQKEVPKEVRDSIYADKVLHYTAKLWNRLHADQADVLRPFKQWSYLPYHWANILKLPPAHVPMLPLGSRLIGGMPEEEPEIPPEPQPELKKTIQKSIRPPLPLPPSPPYNPHHDYEL